MSQPDSNIRTLFTSAKKLTQDLDSLVSSTQEYQDSLRTAIVTFEECRKLADSIALWSPNETEEDISSGGLAYISIDYYLGNLISNGISSNRKGQILHAQEAYERFLTLLDQYAMLSKGDQKLWERYQDDKDAFTLLASSDASERRASKIARFKEGKELEQKIEHYQSLPPSRLQDDAIIRSLYHAEIQLHAYRAFQALDLIAQEIKILALAPPTPAPNPDTLENDYRRRNGQTKDAYSDRLDPPISQLLNGGKAGPILSKEGKPLKPFVLLDNRQKLREGVFRPGHSLPTMTIDEYLEEERRRGGIVEGGGEQSGAPEVVDEDDLVKADAETIKAREWDEFVEANPRGSGNTLNRG